MMEPNNSFIESLQMADTSLDNDPYNMELSKKLLKKKTEIIIDDADYELFRSGDDKKGSIALITKETFPKINYMVRYKTNEYSSIGKSVTQILLWRKIGGVGTAGITDKVFFGYLLSTYPMIMSDSQQTARGREFWINMMRRSIDRNYEVGLSNLNLRSITWYDPKDSLEDWLKENNGRGTGDKHQALRYIISN